MSIELRWTNVEHTVLLYEIHGLWTWAELHTAVLQAHNLMDPVDHVVHSIVDMSAAGRMGDSPLTHGRRLAAATHPHTGLTAFVQAPAFMRVLFSTLSRLYPSISRRIRFVSTREEAYTLIDEYEVEPEAVA